MKNVYCITAFLKLLYSSGAMISCLLDSCFLFLRATSIPSAYTLHGLLCAFIARPPQLNRSDPLPPTLSRTASSPRCRALHTIGHYGLRCLALLHFAINRSLVDQSRIIAQNHAQFARESRIIARDSRMKRILFLFERDTSFHHVYKL